MKVGILKRQARDDWRRHYHDGAALIPIRSYAALIVALTLSPLSLRLGHGFAFTLPFCVPFQMAGT